MAKPLTFVKTVTIFGLEHNAMKHWSGKRNIHMGAMSVAGT